MKVIVDVILLLFFAVAFFALIGISPPIIHIFILFTYLTLCPPVAYYLFAEADPSVSRKTKVLLFPQ